MMIDTTLFEKGDRLLCAVSGGADSMCLLHALWSNRAVLGIDVFAAHFEHGIRGEESLRDARFVEEWCRERGIKCFVEHSDVPGYAEENSLGTEEAARVLRYGFLQRTAEENDCRHIATAHNADDNAETVLFNLTRGSGVKGLAGIPQRRDNIIRPLLNVTRAEIECYLAENHIDHVEDSTNREDAYSRNIIRHRVIPVLREINPGLSDAVLRSSRLLRQDGDCLDGMAAQFIERFYDGQSIPIQELSGLHIAVASRVVRLLCRRTLSSEHVDAVLSLAGGTELAYADVPGQRITREQGRMYFSTIEAVKSWDVEIIPGDAVEIQGANIRVSAELGRKSAEINTQFKTYFIKYENICGKLHCTQRMEGDFIRPAGRGCTKTLKSLFSEKKYTRRQRETTAVFRDDIGILIADGLAVADRCVSRDNDNCLIIRIEKMH